VVTNHHPLDYWVDHTTGTIIVDKQMRQRVWWGDTDWNPELVLEDILSLVEEE
jgi:cytochrome oxidase Cu insertion factor (SCO1/SenC/PrrC family)